jgi:pilus assembly protein FimV
MSARNSYRLMLLLTPSLVLLAPGAALALGLGDIHLKSALNAPLSADIDVTDASADDLASLKATLASRDTFTHFGADYPGFLGNVTFTPQRTPDGHAVLHVTSSGVANEPFATLLVEADWARGHVVREYTVLLDPPTFTSANPSNAAVAAPQVDQGARAGSIESSSSPAASSAAPAPSANAAPGASAPAAAAAAPAAGTPAPATAAPGANGEGGAAATTATHSAGTYTVHRGDTLSSITAQAFPNADRVKRDRALVAIYRDNPRAFERNMNVLLAGSVLKLPGDDELVAIGPGEASAEVRSQYQAWVHSHGGAAAAAGATGEPSGQLRLVAPQEAAREASSSAGPNGAQGANAGNNASQAALQQQVQQLQTQLSNAQRLLQLRDAQLAAMQARLAKTPNAGAPAPAPPAAVAPAGPAPRTAPSAAAQAPATPAVPAPLAHAPAATAPARVASGAKPPVKRPAARPPHAMARASGEQGNSMLDLVLEYWYIPAGVLAVLIALLVARAVRARQDDALDRSLGELPDMPPEPAGKPRSDTLPVRAISAGREEPSYSVEESGTHQRPHFEEASEIGEVSPVAATGQHVTIDEGVAGEVPVALDQGDPLAEADFHMAYGLYDQAAELVQGAIAREPQRRDLKLKLLEVFFVWGNKERFLQSAHELADTREQGPPGEWEKIVIMGRQIAPDDALFADERALAGAASGGIDLNLEGGQNRVDFDLLGEPSLGSSGAAQDHAMDLDLDSALGQNQATGTHGPIGALDPTSEARGLNSGVDFVLDGSELSNDATGSTRKMPGSSVGSASAVTREMPAVAAEANGHDEAEGLAFDHDATGSVEASSEAPTVEQPQLREDEHATIRQKLDAATRHGLVANEQTAELAIDDLGLDLGALETHQPEEGSEAPVSSDAPTMLAQVDEETQRALVRTEAQARSDAPAERAIPGKPAAANGSAETQASPMRATGTWLFTDTDFAQMAPVKGPQTDATQRARTELMSQISAAPPPDTSSTSRMAALDGSRLDLDLSSLESLNGDERSDDLDLDVGLPGSDPTLTARRPALHGAGAGAEAADEGLPDLEPVTLSEVGTKLDLARAYMDMGDPEGARSILSEVLSEGSLSQKQEARRLIDALPG